MGGNQQDVKGPDLKVGVSIDSLKAGEKILGQVDGEPVLLVRRGHEFYAISALCSHYGANLNEGLVTEKAVHCPWHHACFDLETGEALKAPALNPIATWRTQIRGDKVFVLEKRLASSPRTELFKDSRFVIVGSGAAGHAAAEMLRRSGFAGALTILTEDSALPYDRPNLSKDYLAGTAPEEWIPLRPAEFYEKEKIEIRLGARVTQLNLQNKIILLSSGEKVDFDKCLLATGGSPVRPPIEGLDSSTVHFLRSFSDSQRLLQSLDGSEKILIVGAGFIGLEAAAALRTRGCAITVVAPQELPLAHIVGPEIGNFLKSIHESQGVKFRFRESVSKIKPGRVEFKSGSFEEADLVLVATGISPNVSLPQEAGLACEDGILVNEFLETSSPDIFAAGDAARWPDVTGNSLRIEHWVVAQRQGQVAAQNMLGFQKKFLDVPFFWSQQYDLAFRYVGHAKDWTRYELKGSLEKRDCSAAFYKGDRIAAVLTIGRDLQNLLAEQALQRNDQLALRKLFES